MKFPLCKDISLIPVRRVVTRRHKSMCCYVPSLKMGGMIPCESMLEGDAVGIFDHSSDVRKFVPQPWTETVYIDGENFQYTPDFRLTLIDLSEEVIEVKLSKSLRSAKLRHRLNQIAKHFEKTGRRFTVLTELEIRKTGLQRHLKLQTYHARALPKEFDFADCVRALSEIKNLTYGDAVGVMPAQAVLRLISRGCLSHDLKQPLTAETRLQFVSTEVRHAAFQV
jgi:hypothetical protein